MHHASANIFHISSVLLIANAAECPVFSEVRIKLEEILLNFQCFHYFKLMTVVISYFL